MSEQFKPKAGMCAMHSMHGRGSGTLVYIDREVSENRFSIFYVPNGGASSSWAAEEFKPITDPVLLAVAKAYMARKEQKEHQRKADMLGTEAKKWDGVAEVLKELDSAPIIKSEQGECRND